MDNKHCEYIINPTNNEMKYIISLDDIELSLMPMKIYDNNNLTLQKHVDQFHSFEIYTERIGNADSDIKTSKCHICAVDVPQMFLQEHLSGAKHGLFVRVATNAMKRLQLQLLQPFPQIERPICSVYYCDTCSVAVKLSNRDEHKLTTQHINSVKHDALLKQLSDMYIDGECENFDNTVTSVDNNTKNALNVIMTDTSNLNNNQDDSKLVTKSYAKAAATIANKIITDARAKSFDQQIDNNDKKKFNENFNHKNDNKNVIEENDDTVSATSSHGYKIVKNSKKGEETNMTRIEVKNSAGLTMHYLLYRNDHVEIDALSGAKAIVPIDNYHGFSLSRGTIHCKVCMKLVTNKTVHMYEKEHLMKVQGPINDENFYRQLANGYNHCIFCNEVVGEIGIHITVNTKQHLKNVKKSGKKIRKTLKLPKSSKYCDICIERFDDVKQHKKKPSHTRNVQQKLFELTKLEKFEPLNYQLKRVNNDDAIFCRVCKVNILKAAIDEHLKNSEHGIKYKTLLKSNEMIIIKNFIQCKVCNSNIYPGHEIQHTLAKKHTKNLMDFVRSGIPKNDFDIPKKFESKSLDTVNVNSSPLDVPVSSYANKLGTEVVTSYELLPVLSNSYELSDNDGNDNSRSSLHSLDNVEGNLYESKTADVVSLCSEPDCDDNVPSNYAEKKYFCEICKIHLPFDKECIAKHKTSDAHKNGLDRYIEFLITYQLVRIGVHEHNLNVQNHTSGPKKSRQWYCLVCCCEVKSPNTHVRETTHKLKYEELITSNSLVKLDSELFLCKLCDSFVQRSEELKHIREHASHVIEKRLTNRTGLVTKADRYDHESSDLDSFRDCSCSCASDDTTVSSINLTNKVVSEIEVKNTFSDLKPRLLSENENLKNNERPSNESNIKQQDTANTHNQSAASKKHEYTCSVCNVTHERGSKHQQNLNELMMNKQNAVIKKQSPDVTVCKEPETSNTHKQKAAINQHGYTCSVCNVILTNNIGNITSHERGSKHQQKLNELMNKQNAVTKKQSPDVTVCKQPETNNTHKQKAAINQHEYTCSVCNVIVPNNIGNITSHERGSKHQQKLNELMMNKQNAVTKKQSPNVTVCKQPETNNTHKQKAAINQHEYTCSVCNVIVPNNIGNITSHERGSKHQQKLNELMMNKQNAVTKKQSPNVTVCKQPETSNTHKQKAVISQHGYTCSVCNIEVTEHNIESHKYSKTHEQKVKEMSENSNIGTHIKATDYICKICNVKVPNNGNNIKSHENGNPHKRKLKNLTEEQSEMKKNIKTAVNMASTSTKSTSREENKDESEDISATFITIDTPKTDYNYTFWQCKVCYRFYLDYKKVEEHIKGSMHRDRFYKFLDDNSIVAIRNNSSVSLYCEICLDYIHRDDLFTHIEIHI